MRILFHNACLFLILAALLAPATVFGQIEGLRIPNPLDYDTIKEFIEHIIDFAIKVTIFAAPILLIVAGFYFVTAGGNPQQVNKAKNLFLYTIIGVVIIFLAKGVITVIKSLLGGTP